MEQIVGVRVPHDPQCSPLDERPQVTDRELEHLLKGRHISLPVNEALPYIQC